MTLAKLPALGNEAASFCFLFENKLYLWTGLALEVHS